VKRGLNGGGRVSSCGRPDVGEGGGGGWVREYLGRL